MQILIYSQHWKITSDTQIRDGKNRSLKMQRPDFVEGRFHVHLGNHEVLNGSMVSSAELRKAPELCWQSRPERHYAVLMGQNSPDNRDIFVRYLLVNIPGSDISKAQYMIEDTARESPTVKTHVIYLFQQTRVLPVSSEIERANWMNFDSLTLQLGLFIIGEVTYFVDQMSLPLRATSVSSVGLNTTEQLFGMTGPAHPRQPSFPLLIRCRR